ncbi:MAG: hypothetical protein QXX08_02705 [Candidatus Bathyarchaeia archaeon]
MRASVNICLDPKLLKEIDRLRGREKRSTFVEHLLKLGLEAFKEANKK